MKNKLQTIHVCLFVMVLILISFELGFCAINSGKKVQANLDRALKDQGSPSATSANIYKRKPVKFDSGNYRDPFDNPFTPAPEKPQTKAEEVKLPALTVQGVMWGGNYPQAIINNKVVRVGDTTVEGVLIKDITDKTIMVMYKEKPFTISSPAMTVEDPKKKSKGGR